MTSQTVRLTVAQAVVTYLSRQYSVADGQRRRLVPATLGIFGHGNVAGLGQALDQLSDVMPFIQGRNEQALVHAATAFAKHSRRHATLAVTSSIGPGALNMVTGAALATVNRLPVLLLPGDTYATRHQGPVLQQLQHPLEADVTVNDAFRPVCRFFDRITRPEQLLTALPAAMRVLTDPVDAGAVVLSLPQDIQAHAYDFPAAFFAERDWGIRRPQPDSGEVDAVLAMLAAAERPLIIAGGGVIYSGATAELERLAGVVGIPVLETFAGKGAVQQRAWWQIGGIGLEGTPAANALAREADLVLTVGARLTDFATASHSLFANPAVRFASVNVNPRDADRLGATGIIADARQALAALADGAAGAGIRAPAAWRARAEQLNGEWAQARAAALDPDRPFDPAQAGPDVVTSTDAVLTQGQVIGVLQEQARPGDVVIAAAGRPARRPAQGLGRDRRPPLPPGVRLLLHGLRDPGRARGAAGRRRAGRADHLVPRRRNLPAGADRTGHRRPRRPGAHARRSGQPRLPGHPPAADAAQRAGVRQRVPLPAGAAATGRRAPAEGAPAGG